ncbi:MAG: CapA family protein [Victivallaceae bacterium]|nr:CapA family protein [Victivallaceae bacterium]
MTIAFAADWAPIRNFASPMTAAPEGFYHDLLSVLRQCDYRIVNLESPLSNAPTIIKSGAAFSGVPDAAQALKQVPFDAALLANNHTFDCGDEGFRDTIDALRKNGIAHAGAGEDIEEARRELVIEKNGLRVAVFTLSEGEDEKSAGTGRPGVRPWEVDELSREIRSRKKEFDFVIVSAHCGLEYQPYPSFYVWKAFRKLARSGADLIVGHHPHVPQGMTCFGRKPVFFSLGNFGFYQPTDLLYRKIGFMLRIEVTEKRKPKIEKVPYRIAEDGLHLLGGKELKSFESNFEELSKPLKDESSARSAWHAVLAYGNVAGFRKELELILKNFDDNPAKGAAMLRNRLLCPQHNTQWRDGLERIIDGTISNAPAEYVEMVERYHTRTVEFPTPASDPKFKQ